MKLRNMFYYNKILLFTLGILLMSIPGESQDKSFSLGNSFVPSKGQVAIFSAHNFQEIGVGLLPGLIATDRSSTEKGFIVFSEKSSWDNANEHSHVDGYVKSTKDGPFVFPLGDNGAYGAAGFSNARNVEAAYYAVDPSVAVTSLVLSDLYSFVPGAGPFDVASTNDNLEAVSIKEYWDINGAGSTRITIAWQESSDIEELVKSDLAKLTIVGWDGVEWVAIPSTLDEFAMDIHSSAHRDTENLSDFDFGSITTDSEIAPNEYHVYSFGRLSIDREQDNNDMTIYPNPVKSGGFINVRYFLAKSNRGILKVFNSSNQLMIEQEIEVQEGMIKLPLGDHRRGVYTIALTNAMGHTIYKKLIVVDL